VQGFGPLHELVEIVLVVELVGSTRIGRALVYAVRARDAHSSTFTSKQFNERITPLERDREPHVSCLESRRGSGVRRFASNQPRAASFGESPRAMPLETRGPSLQRGVAIRRTSVPRKRGRSRPRGRAFVRRALRACARSRARRRAHFVPPAACAMHARGADRRGPDQTARTRGSQPWRAATRWTSSRGQALRGSWPPPSGARDCLAASSARAERRRARMRARTSSRLQRTSRTVRSDGTSLLALSVTWQGKNAVRRSRERWRMRGSGPGLRPAPGLRPPCRVRSSSSCSVFRRIEVLNRAMLLGCQ
jgi:hypothetical protein